MQTINKLESLLFSFNLPLKITPVKIKHRNTKVAIVARVKWIKSPVLREMQPRDLRYRIVEASESEWQRRELEISLYLPFELVQVAHQLPEM